MRSSYLLQAQRCDIEAINLDSPSRCLDQPEQKAHHAGLARAGAANHADVRAAGYGQVEGLDRWRQLLYIAEHTHTRTQVLVLSVVVICTYYLAPFSTV
jgi:hypothetical protein